MEIPTEGGRYSLLQESSKIVCQGRPILEKFTTCKRHDRNSAGISQRASEVKVQAPRFLSAVSFLILLVLTFHVPVSAGSYGAVIVYGDSYSDNGNLYRAVGWPGPPYWNGRLSNGPVAVEDLASTLGVPLLDYAFGGATTGIGNSVDGGTTTRLGSKRLPGMTTSLKSTEYSIPAAMIPTSLWVIWGSPNDFATDGYTTATADAAAARVRAIVNELRRLGARWVLVAGMPDLGLEPEYLAQGPQFAAWVSYLSNYFNQKLVAALPKGVMYYDTYALYRKIVSDPGGYGLIDVTDPCYNNGIVCSDPDHYLFWDGAHPTRRGHSIVAREFAFTVRGWCVRCPHELSPAIWR